MKILSNIPHVYEGEILITRLLELMLCKCTQDHFVKYLCIFIKVTSLTPSPFPRLTYPGFCTASRNVLTASSLLIFSKLIPLTSRIMSPGSIRPSWATAPLQRQAPVIAWCEGQSEPRVIITLVSDTKASIKSANTFPCGLFYFDM